MTAHGFGDRDAAIAFAKALIVELVMQVNTRRGIDLTPDRLRDLGADAAELAEYLEDHGALAEVFTTTREELLAAAAAAPVTVVGEWPDPLPDPGAHLWGPMETCHKCGLNSEDAPERCTDPRVLR